MPIKDLLKPKSSREISEEINHLETLEFLSKFRKISIKGLKIGFKKRLLHFLVYTYPKKIKKVYWIIWSIWFILILLKYITKDEIFVKGIFSDIQIILAYYIWIQIIPSTISFFIILRINKWERINFNNIQEEILREHIANLRRNIANITQEYIGEVHQQNQNQDNTENIDNNE